MNETLRQLRERRSVRVYEDREIPAEAKAAILEAAAMAPSAGCQQLYTILDIADPALKERLSHTCDHQGFIAQAKLVLIFLADCRKWYEGFRAADCAPRKPGPGDLLLAVADACIAAQNAVVAAHSLGIGSCYIGDILENCEEHRRLLRLPAWVVPAAMLVFGYPTEGQLARKKPERAPMRRVVCENAYPEWDAAALEETFSPRAKGDYPSGMRAFCERKYNSGFAREMNRSAAVYLRDFAPETDDAQRE